MKTTLLLVATAAFVLNACGQKQTNQLKDPSSLADSEAYLLDSVDSNGDDASSGSTTTTSAVADDLAIEKLKEMATRLMVVADSDKSGDLTLDEFLAGPEKMREQFGRSDRPAPSTEKLEKIKVRLTEQFKKFAGEDSLMSSAEIIQFLTESAPRISHHRERGLGHKNDGHKKERGGDRGRRQGQDPRPSWDELVKTYDKDGDGLLNQDEFKTLMDDRRSQDR